MGKPSMFLTLSVNEIHCSNLLKVLHELGDAFTDINVTDPLADLSKGGFNLTRLMRCHLVNEDPVTGFIYFNKLVDCLMALLQAKGCSPLPVSEGMLNTIELVTDLCSVSRDDLPGDQNNNQVHRHAFTYTKRGETTRHFNIPHWPMSETRVLLPVLKDNSRRSGFQLNCLSY
ncbi:helitron_like_N domain-containing protein [Trichonephila clavipes]|nr:helitron_like_N domain-containing protein [Trichonephila clavipes]